MAHEFLADFYIEKRPRQRNLKIVTDLTGPKIERRKYMDSLSPDDFCEDIKNSIHSVTEKEPTMRPYFGTVTAAPVTKYKSPPTVDEKAVEAITELVIDELIDRRRVYRPAETAPERVSYSDPPRNRGTTIMNTPVLDRNGRLDEADAKAVGDEALAHGISFAEAKEGAVRQTQLRRTAKSPSVRGEIAMSGLRKCPSNAKPSNLKPARPAKPLPSKPGCFATSIEKKIPTSNTKWH